MRDFPKLFVLHQETQASAPIPADEREWPEQWKIVEFKEYPRLPRFILPKPQPLQMTIGHVIARRHSRRSFNRESTLSLDQLSSLLFWSAGLNTYPHTTDKKTFFRFYPSGGARYPLEVYFYFRGNDEIPCGIYHYNIKQHCLERLPVTQPESWIRSLPTYYAWVYDAALVLFITALFDRTMCKYRGRGYRFGLLEAGALMQNFYLITEAIGLGCCAVGSPFDQEVEAALEASDNREAALIALAIGPLVPA